MKLVVFCAITAVSAGLVVPAPKTCQPPREMRPAFENLNFAEGTPGGAPLEWYLGPEWFNPQRVPGHGAKTVSGSVCRSGQQCATVYSIGKISSGDLSFLYQNVDATKYRGKMLTYRASVRADVASGAMARLLVRAHRMDCSTSFRDDMGDHPITASGWSSYQLHAPIGQDARDIEFGMQLIGSGAAWIDNITMTFADAK